MSNEAENKNDSDSGFQDRDYYASHPSGIPPRLIMAGLNGNLANVVKYAMRLGRKIGADDDLQKAITYLRFERETLARYQGLRDQDDVPYPNWYRSADTSSLLQDVIRAERDADARSLLSLVATLIQAKTVTASIFILDAFLREQESGCW